MKRLVDKSMLGQAWVLLNDIDFAATTDLSEDLVRNILTGRGICNQQEVEKFLSPTIK